jgi:adenylate cyclase
MGKQKTPRKKDAVSWFSIGAKLMTIISILLLISLGAITVLVSVLVSQDLRFTAEDNNFEINRRSAMEAEYTFTNIQANSIVVMQFMYHAGVGNNLAMQAAEIFLHQNPDVAALAFSIPGQPNEILISERFFASHDIEVSLAEFWFEKNDRTFERGAAGETLLLNATPDFAIHLLAMGFPWMEGAGAVVLFSPESLIDSLGFGLNQSYLINGEGDILIHSNFDMVRAGINMADRSFVRIMQQSPQQNFQTLFHDDDGVSAFDKGVKG